MEARNKNILIGGLLAIVLVMAVGYAAFATNLQINGTAEITSSWDVHFNSSAQVSGDVDPTKTFSGGQLPTGTLTYASGDAPLSATVSASLNQPGDQVVFTLRIINAGTLPAIAATPTLSGASFTIDGMVATQGHIKFTVAGPSTSTPLAANNGTTTMTVTAEFIDTNEAVAAHCDGAAGATEEACEDAGGTWVPATEGTTGNMTGETSGDLTITLNYTQYVANN